MVDDTAIVKNSKSSKSYVKLAPVFDKVPRVWAIKVLGIVFITFSKH